MNKEKEMQTEIMLDNEIIALLEQQGVRSARVYHNGFRCFMDGTIYNDPDDEEGDYCFSNNKLIFNNRIKQNDIVIIDFPHINKQFVIKVF
jgi:hypothetical protein